MSEPRPVGLTKGPGETPHEFTFVSPDREQALKVGEFVTYSAEVAEKPRHVLARVTNRRPLRLYPDAFLADPDIDPDDVAALIGYSEPGHELFELTATIIGYYDDRLGSFVNPRLPPRTGRPIHLAADDMLAAILSKKRKDDTGAAHVGSLLSREPGRVPLAVDLGPITSTHLAIIASTGAGKSYLAAVLIEEMMKPNNRAAVLIVDPHGEYQTLAEMSNTDAFCERLPEASLDRPYRPDVRIFKPGDVKVRASSLTLADLAYLLPNLSDRMEYLLRRAIRDVRNKAKRDKGDADRWTVGDLQVRLRELGQGHEQDFGHQGQPEGDERYAETAEAVNWRLESVLGHSIIFHDFEQLDLSELFQPGRCSVLQLNEIDEKEQRVMVATLLRRLFRARTDTAKKRVAKGDELYLPYPAFVLMEEAHHFAPAGTDVVSTGILKQVLAEGRKFGVAIGLISQRPGKLDSDVLSQCNTQFILRIVNPVDQARVAESVETVGRDLLQELPALSKGQVIVAGEAVNTPVLCQVRERHTSHGAQTLDAPSEWMDYFAPEQQARRERENALPAQPDSGGRSKMFK